MSDRQSDDRTTTDTGVTDDPTTTDTGVTDDRTSRHRDDNQPADVTDVDSTDRNDRSDRRNSTRNEDPNTVRMLSGLVSLVGLWILASPFVFAATETAMWNHVAVGAAIFLLAGYNYYRTTKTRTGSVGLSSLVALLGLWVLASPYVLEMGSNELFWSSIVSGLAVAVIAGYNAYANRNLETARTGTRA